MGRAAAIVLGLVLAASACGADSASVPAAGEPTAAAAPRPGAVPAEEIVFDTFGAQGPVPLSEASDDLIAALVDAIPPLTEPPYEPRDRGDAWLADDDLVLGHVDADGVARAFPHRILNLHEIVNDTFAGVPVLVSYCPLCRSGVVYDRRLDGTELTFGNTSALYENDLVMFDRQTDSYWWQVAGRSIFGPLAGEELDALPSVTTTWSAWSATHPDTLVLSRDLGFGRGSYQPRFEGYAERVNDRRTPFPVSDEVWDDRRFLPAQRVVGVVVDGVARAWPVTADVGEWSDTVAGTDVVVRSDGGGLEILAVEPTGALTPLASRSSFWFAWVSAFPDTEVGRLGTAAG